jgi:hypothetical protein
MNILALTLVALYTMLGVVTPIHEVDGPTQSFTVSNSIPSPKFDRISGISIIKAPVYAQNDRLSATQLKDLLYSVGFRGEHLREAWGIVMKESTGRPMAHNQNSKTGDNSHGLFQINMIGNLGPARLKEYGLNGNEELFDPLTNAKIGYTMSNGGKNWSPWNGLGSSAQKWMKEFPE